MNLMHLKYAVEIARTKSISQAAENLYMGQPNLSRAIRDLEEDLGVTLFNRTTRGITVTAEGEEFLQYARSILAQVDEVEALYRGDRRPKQKFSVCVPRASYISCALADFAAQLKQDVPTEIFYKETNAWRTVNNVVSGEYNLGIVRYQSSFEKYFREMFAEKHLTAQTVTEFTYLLLVSKNHPLAQKKDFALADLAPYTEITHADPYVPSLPLVDVQKQELSRWVDKHIFVFERGSQFELLEHVPGAFIWVSPVPQELCDKYGLVQLSCAENTRTYKDVLISRRGYRFSELDNLFVTAVSDARRRYLRG